MPVPHAFYFDDSRTLPDGVNLQKNLDLNSWALIPVSNPRGKQYSLVFGGKCGFGNRLEFGDGDGKDNKNSKK